MIWDKQGVSVSYERSGAPSTHPPSRRDTKGAAKEKKTDTGGGWVFSLDVTLSFWPRAGAFGAGAILELCAQLMWCEL